MKICVFCASSESVDNVYFKAAADLGKEIVTRGWELLYGGTNCGLMREVSDAVKNVIYPLLQENEKELGMKAEINV